MALLEVRDLKVSYRAKGGMFARKKYVHAVNGVTFALDKGEILGLVGESGCGKSTLGRALVGLVKPESGSILLDGRELTGKTGPANRKALLGKYQMIFQDPYGSLNPRLTIFESLDEVLRLHLKKADKNERRIRAGELLEKVGLGKDALDRYPHQFSGGQRQRIGIARALSAEPLFIVADEPVSALDVSVQASIVNLLDDIRRETGTAFLFIAHDLAVVEHVSSRIAVMYLGEIVELAPAEKLVDSAAHPYTKALISAVPELGGDRKSAALSGDVPSPLELPTGCPFHPRCPRAQACCREKMPEMSVFGDDPEHLCRCFFPETEK